MKNFRDGVSDADTPLGSAPVKPDPTRMRLEASDRVLRRLAALVAVWVVVLLPIRVVGLGFRPTDDARRHVAKVLADKPWSEVLVLRPEATVDPHPGWHALLSFARRCGVSSPMSLFVLSIVGLGASFLALPLLLGAARPDSWLLTLLVTAVASDRFFNRIFLGRPFLVSMIVLLVVSAFWRRLAEERFPLGAWSTLAGLLAVAIWMHGNWYLWLLPAIVFAFADQLRVALRFTTALAVGTSVGSLATGAPLAFLAQTLRHPLWALSTDLPRRVLVGEFQPSTGEPIFLIALLAVVAWKVKRGSDAETSLRRDPLLLMTAVCWALGFHTQRFWWDWGMPVALVWMAQSLDQRPSATLWRPRAQLLVTTLLAAVLFLAVTNDRESRWSSSERSPFLSLEKPEYREWLPRPGGVLYSNSMRVFYNTFWKNPHAPWRYMVGFEPALMPPADLAIYRHILLEYSSDASFSLWVEKMRPEDRLVIVRNRVEAPRIEMLEWYSPYKGMWIGRLPVSGTPAAPSRSPEFELEDPEAVEPESGPGPSRDQD